MSQILLFSSEPGMSAILVKLLKTEGYKVLTVRDIAKAKELIQRETFNLVVSCVSPDVDPDLSVVRSAQSIRPGPPVVLIVEKKNTALAARIAERKPFACIEKPLKVDQFLATVQKAVDYSDSAVAESVNLDLQLETCYQFEKIVAESPAMRSVCDMISRVAGTDIAVMIAGEHGTGKELAARTIHENSRRRERGFTIVGCAAPDADAVLFGNGRAGGRLEQANGGTLFLKEIAALSPDAQERLLHVLQEKAGPTDRPHASVGFDARVISGTAQNISQMVSEGKFSGELYKVLRVIFIRIPPLRERPQDVLPLIRQTLREKLGEDKPLPVFDAEAIRLLERYSWPANLRAVGSVVEQMLSAASSGRITCDCLPAEVRNQV